MPPRRSGMHKYFHTLTEEERALWGSSPGIFGLSDMFDEAGRRDSSPLSLSRTPFPPPPELTPPGASTPPPEPPPGPPDTKSFLKRGGNSFPEPRKTQTSYLLQNILQLIFILQTEKQIFFINIKKVNEIVCPWNNKAAIKACLRNFSWYSFRESLKITTKLTVIKSSTGTTTTLLMVAVVLLSVEAVGEVLVLVVTVVARVVVALHGLPVVAASGEGPVPSGWASPSTAVPVAVVVGHELVGLGGDHPRACAEGGSAPHRHSKHVFHACSRHARLSRRKVITKKKKI